MREPRAVTNFFVDFEQTLSDLMVDVPQAFVSLIRTTNLLEHFHKGIRRITLENLGYTIPPDDLVQLK